MKDLKIIVTYEYPPIPLRTMDWCAYLPDYVDLDVTWCQAYGATRAEALRNLADAIEDRESEGKL